MSILFNNVYQGPPGPPEFEYPILYEGDLTPGIFDMGWNGVEGTPGSLSRYSGYSDYATYGSVDYTCYEQGLRDYKASGSAGFRIPVTRASTDIPQIGNISPKKFRYTGPDNNKYTSDISLMQFITYYYSSSTIDTCSFSSSGFLTKYSEYNEANSSSPIVIELNLDNKFYIKFNRSFTSIFLLDTLVSKSSTTSYSYYYWTTSSSAGNYYHYHAGEIVPYLKYRLAQEQDVHIIARVMTEFM